MYSLGDGKRRVKPLLPQQQDGASGITTLLDESDDTVHTFRVSLAGQPREDVARVKHAHDDVEEGFEGFEGFDVDTESFRVGYQLKDLKLGREVASLAVDLRVLRQNPKFISQNLTLTTGQAGASAVFRMHHRMVGYRSPETHLKHVTMIMPPETTLHASSSSSSTSSVQLVTHGGWVVMGEKAVVDVSLYMFSVNGGVPLTGSQKPRVFDEGDGTFVFDVDMSDPVENESFEVFVLTYQATAPFVVDDVTSLSDKAVASTAFLQCRALQNEAVSGLLYLATREETMTSEFIVGLHDRQVIEEGRDRLVGGDILVFSRSFTDRGPGLRRAMYGARNRVFSSSEDGEVGDELLRRVVWDLPTLLYTDLKRAKATLKTLRRVVTRFAIDRGNEGVTRKILAGYIRASWDYFRVSGDRSWLIAHVKAHILDSADLLYDLTRSMDDTETPPMRLHEGVLIMRAFVVAMEARAYVNDIEGQPYTPDLRIVKIWGEEVRRLSEVIVEMHAPSDITTMWDTLFIRAFHDLNETSLLLEGLVLPSTKDVVTHFGAAELPESKDRETRTLRALLYGSLARSSNLRKEAAKDAADACLTLLDSTLNADDAKEASSEIVTMFCNGVCGVRVFGVYGFGRSGSVIEEFRGARVVKEGVTVLPRDLKSLTLRTAGRVHASVLASV